MTIKEAQQFRMRFGKYHGRSLEEIAVEDLLYLDWLASLDTLLPVTAAAVVLMCQKHAREIERAIERRNR